MILQVKWVRLLQNQLDNKPIGVPEKLDTRTKSSEIYAVLQKLCKQVSENITFEHDPEIYSVQIAIHGRVYSKVY